MRFGTWFGPRKQKAYGLATMTPSLQQALTLWDGGLASYGTVYRKLAPVRTAVDFLADAISTTSLKVYRRSDSGRPEARDHPLAELIRHPNPDLTTARLIRGTASDLAIYGNAYWRKVQSGRSKVLVPLPPFRVTPQGGDLLRPSYYDFFPADGTAPKRIDADEMVHFRLYDPEDRRVGSSKLEALRNVLLEEVEASRHRKGFWANHARIEGVLEHPGALSDDAFTRLRTQFDNTYTGSENSGKTAILEEGMTWKASGFSPKDAEFVQGRLFVLEATARVFNIPLPVLSLTQTATFASQVQFRTAIYQDTLPPWFETIQSEIELQLMPWFADTDDLYVEFNVESKIRGNFMEQIEIFAKALGGGSTPGFMLIEEVRDRLNLDRLDDPRARELVVPLNVSLGEATPPLAPVTELPRAASALETFFNRQERTVMSKIGAKSDNAFDRERWDRELAEVIGDDEAARVNLRTELELATDDPHAVFERARIRATELGRVTDVYETA